MSVEDLASKGSPACQEAFAFLREQLKSDPNVEEAVECGPLKETGSPACNVKETPRVRVFFGEELEVFLFILERAVASIMVDESVPEALRVWVDRAQLGGMSRLLRVQLRSKADVGVLIRLIKAVTSL